MELEFDAKRDVVLLSETQQSLPRRLKPLTEEQQLAITEMTIAHFDCNGRGYFIPECITYIEPCEEDESYYAIGFLGQVGWHDFDFEAFDDKFIEEKNREFEAWAWLKEDDTPYVFSVNAT